jgi:hypothetical protein
MGGLYFQLLDHGETLVLKDLGNACLEPMPSLQTQLFAKLGREVMVIGLQVVAIPEELMPHGRAWTLQGTANIRHADIFASISK